MSQRRDVPPTYSASALPIRRKRKADGTLIVSQTADVEMDSNESVPVAGSSHMISAPFDKHAGQHGMYDRQYSGLAGQSGKYTERSYSCLGTFEMYGPPESSVMHQEPSSLNQISVDYPYQSFLDQAPSRYTGQLFLGQVPDNCESAFLGHLYADCPKPPADISGACAHLYHSTFESRVHHSRADYRSFSTPSLADIFEQPTASQNPQASQDPKAGEAGKPAGVTESSESMEVDVHALKQAESSSSIERDEKSNGLDWTGSRM